MGCMDLEFFDTDIHQHTDLLHPESLQLQDVVQ